MKKMKMIALFMIFLVITIPIVVAQGLRSISDDQLNQNALIQEGLNQNILIPPTGAAAEQPPLVQIASILDSYRMNQSIQDRCRQKADNSEEKLKFLDNDIIRTVEGVLNIARTICITMGALDTIFSTLGEVIGFLGPDSACCNAGWLTIGIACKKEWAFYTKWENAYAPVKVICCIVTCGWCSGGCYGLPGILGGKGGGGEGAGAPEAGQSEGLIPQPKYMPFAIFTPPELGQPKSPFAPSAETQASNIAGMAASEPRIPQSAETYTGGGGKQIVGSLYGKGGGISSIGLSPYENIYTAIACLCPGAILMNLRKLKAIYEVHACCVNKACEDGLPTESCDASLDESLCMYWEGSLISSLAKIIVHFVVQAIFKNIGLTEIQANMIKCILAIFELIQTPQTIQGVISEWQRSMKSFEKPSCDDLGFKDTRSSFDQVNEDLRNQIPLRYEDFNKDGYADGTTEEGEKEKRRQAIAEAERAAAEQKAWMEQREWAAEQMRGQAAQTGTA